MPLKHYLLTPGPTPVPERVALAMAHPIPHHRAPAFEALFAEVRDGLKWLYDTKSDVLTFACSGTGAMEGSIVNFFKPGDEIVTVNGGKFGERWGKIGKAYGLTVHELKVEWGKAVDPAAVEKALRDHPTARAVCVQASESSTGVAHPVREIAQITGRGEALCIVDAVSALGAMPLPMDEWGIDVLVTGSQKALMLPPGLAFGAASEKAWKRNETATLPRFYFDWKREREMQRKNQTAWTPSISLLMGLAEVIRWLRELTLPAVYERHERLARASRAAMTAIGCKLYAERPVVSLTTVWAPEGIDSDKLVKTLKTKYGVTLVGGQDAAKGKIFRIAHLGYFDDLDIVVAVAAIERALADLGYKAKPFGTGVGAAMAAMGE
ncbi:MAG TPA: alanine--glyoxylate aminotransferase family protein [Myxococcales bacterium]|nr:alanine--glyoxylate aminotransferase family protein [Myxococcales bacterium]